MCNQVVVEQAVGSSTLWGETDAAPRQEYRLCRGPQPAPGRPPPQSSDHRPACLRSSPGATGCLRLGVRAAPRPAHIHARRRALLRLLGGGRAAAEPRRRRPRRLRPVRAGLLPPGAAQRRRVCREIQSPPEECGTSGVHGSGPVLRRASGGVPRQGDNGEYVVRTDPASCICTWWRGHEGTRGVCKHILAAQLESDHD